MPIVSRSLVFAILFASLPLAAQINSSGQIQEILLRASKDVSALSTDPTIVAAVKKHNALKMSMAEVKRADSTWANAPANAPIVKKVIEGELAGHLQKVAPRSRGFVEVLLMAGIGEVIAATSRPSDYWQGDEPQWQKAYAGGKGATFVDRLRFDTSRRATLGQISVPVFSEGRAIGVISFGLDVSKYR